MADQEEKKNRRIGMITSIGVHLALILAFLFIMAWRAPNPPLPEYGIELNFGLDDQGYGEVQPETPANEAESAEEQPPVEEDAEQAEEVVEEASPEEVQEQAEQPVSKVESPVTVTEVKKESKPTPKKEEKPVEKKQTETEKKEVLVAYNADSQKKDGPTNANHGDNPGTQGDKGSKEGALDQNAMFDGKQGGGGGGTSLDMTGWDWAEKLVVTGLPENDFGRIAFLIECDENGDITKITTEERGLSPQSEKILKDIILRNSLVRTASGAIPEKSSGRVTIVVRSK
ncbi:MAG: hypothetical protein RIB47_15140 [Cyclobacteriaceae bacterium]